MWRRVPAAVSGATPRVALPARAQRARAGFPGGERVAGEAGVELDERGGAPQDVARELGLLAREAARQVDGRHGLVDRVGEYVLVEEGRHALAASEPAQAVGVAAVGDRRLHLEEREVAGDRAAQAAVQAEERHEVDRRERHRRQVVEVRAVARVQAQRVHRVREELRVDALGVAAAVLVGLDLHERGLRPAVQARQRPRVRVGLLELVGRAVSDELEHLLERRVAFEIARERRPVVGLGDRPQREVHVVRRIGQRRLGTAARSASSKHVSRSRRSASRLGSHSHASATPGNPR